MAEWWTYLWALPAVQGAVIGFGSAVIVDYRNFTAWQRWQDGITYNWSVASLRWVQGAVGGALVGLGILPSGGV